MPGMPRKIRQTRKMSEEDQEQQWMVEPKVTWTAPGPSKGVPEALAADCANGDGRTNGDLTFQWRLECWNLNKT